MFWIDYGEQNYYLYIKRKAVMRVSWQPEIQKWRRYRFNDFGQKISESYFDTWKEPRTVNALANFSLFGGLTWRL